MAKLASIGTGNWLTAGTWGLIDATLFANSETSTVVCPTAYSNVARSAQATPGAIVVSHIGVKLSVRTGTTGTMTVHIADSSHNEIAGTAVTINCSDLPVAATTDLNGGWHFFKLGTPKTLTAATLYEVEAKTSSSSQISLFASAATSGMSCALITTTTQAPVAGDDVFIQGEYTGAGTSNSFTVTMDETATTDYGAASTSLVTPAIAISNKGTLTWGTTAATNYNLKVSGNIVIYSGGTKNMGSVGAECPRNSSMTLLLDCASNVDFGIVVRNLGTFVAQGLSRTSGKIYDRTLLNADAAANATTLTVVDDTGWLDNDEIAVASTTQTYSQVENGQLNGNAGATSLTVDTFAGTGGGVLNAHSGTSPTQAEVVLLTRNVLITGVSVTVGTYIDIRATATVDFDWVAMKWMGSSTANKRGIDSSSTTGTCSFNYCCFRNFEVSAGIMMNITGTAPSSITISNCIFYRFIQVFVTSINSTGTGLSVSSCIFMSQISNTSLAFSLGTFSNSINNCTFTSFQATVISNSSTGSQITGTYDNHTFHSNNSSAININCRDGGFSGWTIWRHARNGIALNAMQDVTLTNFTIFGCTTQNILAQAVVDVTFINLVSNGDSTFSTTFGQGGLNNASAVIKYVNCDFSTVTGIKRAHSTADISTSGTQVQYKITCINTKLGASTEVSSPQSMQNNGFVTSQKNDQTTATHKIWKRNGTMQLDTGTVHTGSQSLKMTPSTSGTFRFDSSGQFGGFKAAVANGATVTPTVYVYKDGSYSGNQPRLIVKRNDALGISADTVLATYSAGTGSWNALSGTTAAVTDDGTLEFVVDCDGNAGNIYIDSITMA